MRTVLIALLSVLLLVPPLPAHAGFRFSPRVNKAHLIQWRSWGAEALAEAKEKGKPVLLSLSAVWCHWCHVMDETTYSDDAVIAYINERFIPIRVDADERPDIDALYNQGGWPSTIILTPDGEVMSGGTYMPATELLARLTRMYEMFSTDQDSLADRLKELRARREFERLEKDARRRAPDRQAFERITQTLAGTFDPLHGGFGMGQKFPNPDAIDFLLSHYAKSGNSDLKKIISTTLDRMAVGAINDRVEGGFFRYSTKLDWSEPHYEKMLDGNAGMIRNYAAAFQATGNKEYLSVMKNTVRYVQASLHDPASGAFFGSQDADEAYYAKQDRSKSQKPFVDRTSYADTSSVMISALVTAYSATGERQYLDMAEKGMDFLQKNMGAGTAGVAHAYRNGKVLSDGLLMDSSLFGLALLDLYTVTGDRKYRMKAIELGRLIADRFYNADAQQFRMSLEAPIVRPVSTGVLSDMMENLASYRAIELLGRIAWIDDDPRFREVRDQALMTVSRSYEQFPQQAGSFGRALLWSQGEPVQIIILADGQQATRYLAELNGVFVPEKVVRVLSVKDDADEIRKLRYPVSEAVYLCAGKRCSKPITKHEDLRGELKEFIGMKKAK